MDLFLLELEQQVTALNDGMIAFASGDSSGDTLNALMRAAHSIKGAARIVGLQAVVDLAHAMEDCFVAAQEGKVQLHGDRIEVLLKSVDQLSRVGREGESPQCKREASQLAAALRAPQADSSPGHVAGKTHGPAPAASKPAEPAPDRAPVTATPERAVRVNAGSLNRLLGLAGEYRVNTRWLETFAKSLRSLKENQLLLADLFERLHKVDHVSEAQGSQVLFEAQQQRTKCEELAGACISDFERFAYSSDGLAHRLYAEVLASRMRPFADGIQGFPRMVHDLARKLGKNVRFEVMGKTTEVDRDILDKLEAPLTHILGNALDHGIETPAERLAAGKPEQATLRLEASHKGGMLLVVVSDDGRGIDLDKIRRKIVARNLAAPEMVLKMREAELLDFLFLPGFSTAGVVTEVSGRGVGLDVVQTMLHETGGQTRIVTTPGKGTHFHLQLPITLSVVRVLLVEIGGESYAFPLARIERVLSIQPEEVHSLQNRQFITFDGKHIGLVPAHQALDVPPGLVSSSQFSVVVLAGRTGRYGLTVDRFIGERDVVVRPLDVRLGKVENVTAAASMEDGAPLLILDVEDIIHSIDSMLTGGRLRKIKVSEAAEVKHRKRILVVDDSVTVREVVRKLLQNKGYGVEVAADGMDGWHAVRAGRFDLVISDVDMPRMNGIEFVTRIKRDTRLKNIPVMIVSYKDREGDRLRGLEAGANYYLAKSSFQDETLINAVQDLIGAPN
jgi:two-component system sensor histidine kinase and response regulator WspE